MITVLLPGDVVAHVDNGIWKCNDDMALNALRSMPMIVMGYYLHEDDKLADNAIEVFGGKRVYTDNYKVASNTPSGAVF